MALIAASENAGRCRQRRRHYGRRHKTHCDPSPPPYRSDSLPGAVRPPWQLGGHSAGYHSRLRSPSSAPLATTTAAPTTSATVSPPSRDAHAPPSYTAAAAYVRLRPWPPQRAKTPCSTVPCSFQQSLQHQHRLPRSACQLACSPPALGRFIRAPAPDPAVSAVGRPRRRLRHTDTALVAAPPCRRHHWRSHRHRAPLLHSSAHVVPPLLAAFA